MAVNVMELYEIHVSIKPNKDVEIIIPGHMPLTKQKGVEKPLISKTAEIGIKGDIKKIDKLDIQPEILSITQKIGDGKYSIIITSYKDGMHEYSSFDVWGSGVTVIFCPRKMRKNLYKLFYNDVMQKQLSKICGTYPDRTLEITKRFLPSVKENAPSYGRSYVNTRK